jgi:glycosyltransferase involved in cell wall biosynthesis
MAMPKNEMDVASGRVLDISRLLSRLHRRAPTGIDRVELAYARHYLDAAASRDVRFLLTTPINTALLARPLAGSLVRAAVARWSDPHKRAEDDPAFGLLREALQAPLRAERTHRTINVSPPSDELADARMMAMKAGAYVHGTVRGAVTPRGQRLPRGSGWYLHVSHINLHDPPRLAWCRAAGLRRMFLVHDLIPISHPEYCRPDEDVRHRRRIETVARLADVVIFNSAFTKAAWRDYVEQHGLPQPRGAVVPLAVEDVFRAGPQGPRLEADVPYFVVVGTIEARKNLAFLLHVWKQWTQATGGPRARLVIVGRRGWESENVFDLLDRSAALAPSVIEVAELGDRALAALLRGARAALAPSLVEGFGLPIAEALALGVPVIASDIEAFREVGGAFADYVDPIDGPGWLTAFEDYVQPGSPRHEAMRGAALLYRPGTWAAHVQSVESILAEQP